GVSRARAAGRKSFRSSELNPAKVAASRGAVLARCYPQRRDARVSLTERQPLAGSRVVPREFLPPLTRAGVFIFWRPDV
ncbi:MAG: hypothetical protein WCG34_05810, partial [Leptolinea sp.]